MKVPDRAIKALLFVPGPAPAASFVAADRDALARARPDGRDRPDGRVAAARVRGGDGARRRRGAPCGGRPLVRGAVLRRDHRGGLPRRPRSAPRGRLAGPTSPPVPAIGFGEARGGWRRALVRAGFSRAPRWSGPSRAAAAREIAAVARPRPRSRVVPPAVDTAFFQPPAQALPARERLVVSTCAAITPLTIVQKGLDRLVEAAAVASPTWPVVITGAARPAIPRSRRSSPRRRRT